MWGGTVGASTVFGMHGVGHQPESVSPFGREDSKLTTGRGEHCKVSPRSHAGSCSRPFLGQCSIIIPPSLSSFP